MERFIHDENNGLDYELVGDYYLPCLKAPDSPKTGIFGKAHFHYLRAEKKLIFDGLLLSGKLGDYLENLDRQTEEMFSLLVEQKDKDNLFLLNSQVRFAKSYLTFFEYVLY